MYNLAKTCSCNINVTKVGSLRGRRETHVTESLTAQKSNTDNLRGRLPLRLMEL